MPAAKRLEVNDRTQRSKDDTNLSALVELYVKLPARV